MKSKHALPVIAVLMMLLSLRPAAAQEASLEALQDAAAAMTAADAELLQPPEDMLLIPGGEFIMGKDGFADYSPAHQVRLYPFLIDRREVSNADYLLFCEATERRLPAFWGIEELSSGPEFPDHPAIGVSWSDAIAYARWRGARLPTEAEWEKAARGGLVGHDFSHGNDLDSTLYAAGAYTGGPGPIAQFPPNGYGLHDMTRGVCEWVYDRYDRDYYKQSPELNPVGPSRGAYRVIRGAGWHTGPGCCAVYYRTGLKSNWLDFNVGFRCAKYVGESAADRFSATLKSDGLQSALAEFKAFRASLSGEYYFRQSEFNNLGFALLAEDKMNAAIAVFELTVAAYPGSYNALDSLAEAWRKKGDRARSIELYRQALTIHPGCQTSCAALAEMEAAP